VEVYSTEEQQVEAIKKWWHENKWSVVGGIIIGISVLWGGRAWMDTRHAHNELASGHYQVMLEQIAQGKNEDAASQGQQLLGQFSDTPYAGLAALAMAKIKVEQGDNVAAMSHLHWALDNAKQDAVKHEARLRLAKLLLADGKTAEALAQLQGVETGAYAASYDQLMGDIHVAEGKLDEARTDYSRALTALAPTAQGRKELQMKLDDLGQVPAQAAAE
jgi:predicted negative regulator of RcsB-dependent stress response